MTAKSPQHKLGEAIRASRNERGYSQEGFAAHAGMDRSYYGAIERGGFNFTEASSSATAGTGSTHPRLAS
jgi:transcriptional regulator with XRE-family HTH domain